MWQDAKSLNAAANGLIAMALLACIAGGVWWLAQRPFFNLKVIRVEAMAQSDLQHINAVALETGIQGRIKGNFFTANLDNVRQVFESVPWVRRASVRREWPNELIVSLEEHEALGTWGEDGRLLSTRGDVFTANLGEAEEDHELPEFYGPDGSEKDVLARYADLTKWFAAIKLVPEFVSLSSRYAWTVRLDNGLSVALGREQTATTLKERVDRLTRICPQLVDRLKNIDTIDMRYQNGLALSASDLVIPDDVKKAVSIAPPKKQITKPQPPSKHTQ